MTSTIFFSNSRSLEQSGLIIETLEYVPILGYNPMNSQLFFFQPKVKSILLFYWNLTTYGGWFEKKRAQWSCWTLLAILQKREAPWRQELKRFFCLLTMLTQWGEIISELKRINKVRIQHKDIFQSFYPLITLR